MTTDYDKCGTATIPDEDFDEITTCNIICNGYLPQGTGKSADLIVYVTAQQISGSCNGVYAYAASCQLNSNDRPVGGLWHPCVFGTRVCVCVLFVLCCLCGFVCMYVVLFCALF